MDCPTEQTLIQDKLSKLAGIDKLDFNLINRILGVWHSLPSTAPIEAAISSLGMQAEPLSAEGQARIKIEQMDCPTEEKLIRDKLGDADWEKHLGQSDSVLVNASTWGLMLTGKLVNLNDLTRADVPGAFKRLVGRVGEPVIRLAVRQAMRIMGHQFVMGRTIDEALARSRKGGNADYRYSFDMLGEGALTTKDAARYLEAYRQAIHAIGRTGPVRSCACIRAVPVSCGSARSSASAGERSVAGVQLYIVDSADEAALRASAMSIPPPSSCSPPASSPPELTAE